jgi:hypothetical protein
MKKMRYHIWNLCIIFLLSTPLNIFFLMKVIKQSERLEISFKENSLPSVDPLLGETYL